MADRVHLSREELYERVWAESLRTLAPTFGLSDVGLNKLCRRHDIPTPGLGYWAKVEHGKRVTRIPLPPAKTASRDPVLVYRPRAEERVGHKQGLLAAWIARDQALECRVTVSSGGPLRHRLTTATEPQLRASAPDAQGWIVPPHGSLAVRVSHEQRARALDIMDALLTACEARGWSVHTEPIPARRPRPATPEWYPGSAWLTRAPEKREAETGVRIVGQMVWFSVVELSTMVAPTEVEIRAYRRQFPGVSGEPPWQKKPSGELRLEITHHLGVALRRRWTDSEKQRLEDQLNGVLTGMVRIASALRASALHSALSRRRETLRERRRRDAQLRREALERDIAQLKRGMKRWRWQTSARAFLAMLRAEAARRGIVAEDFGRWLTWAEQYVENRGMDKFFAEWGNEGSDGA